MPLCIASCIWTYHAGNRRKLVSMTILNPASRCASSKEIVVRLNQLVYYCLRNGASHDNTLVSQTKNGVQEWKIHHTFRKLRNSWRNSHSISSGVINPERFMKLTQVSGLSCLPIPDRTIAILNIIVRTADILNANSIALRSVPSSVK